MDDDVMDDLIELAGAAKTMLMLYRDHTGRCSKCDEAAEDLMQCLQRINERRTQ